MSTHVSARMATIWKRKRWDRHCKQRMDERRMWTTKGIVLESVKIKLYVPDL